MSVLREMLGVKLREEKMRQSTVRFGLIASALLCSVAVSGEPPPIQQQQQQQTDKDREISRLRGELRLSQKKLSACKKRLAKAKAVIKRGKQENVRLRKLASPEALAYVKDCAAGQLLSFYQWLAETSRENGLSPHQQETLLGLLEAAMDDWSRGDSERKALMDRARRWLYREAKSLEAAATQGAREVLAINEVRENPIALCVLLDGLDRGEKAKLVAEMVGTHVAWRGVVIETVDRRAAAYQLELYCQNVTVFANVADKRPGALAGIRKGMDVWVEGRIRDIGDTYGACTSVLLENAKISHR